MMDKGSVIGLLVGILVVLAFSVWVDSGTLKRLNELEAITQNQGQYIELIRRTIVDELHPELKEKN